MSSRHRQAETTRLHDAVASIHDMTEEWIAATLGPVLLRQAADYHRTRAVQLARTVNEQKARR